MKISDIHLTYTGSSSRLECTVQSDSWSEVRQCYFETESDFQMIIRERYDPFAIGLLPMAMALGEDMEVDGPIDIQLHNNICEAIALFKTWFPSEVKDTQLTCRGYTNSTETGSRISSFFSGGVDALFNCAFFDSSYASNPITDLILVHGMDISIKDVELWDETRARLSETAKKLGKNFVTVRTNLRDFQDYGVNYVHTGFGPILGSVSNLFSAEVGLSLIGSYGLFSELAPHASGPLVDRLWSSSAQSVTHFTPRFTRLEKIRVIAERSPSSLTSLRVCWKNPGAAYNCGVCEKCLRTRMELKIVGALEFVETFPKSDMRSDIALLGNGIPDDDIYTYYFWKEIADLEKDPVIVRYIKKSLKSFHYRRQRYIFKKWMSSTKRSLKKFIRIFLK
jgi:hypothetical protein